MKRWIPLLLSALALAAPSASLGYTGPGSATYDHTINAIHLTLTAQSVTLDTGPTRFAMSAQVPIVPNAVGRQVLLEIYKVAADGDVLVGNCAYDVMAEDVGTTLTIPCELFAVIPWIPDEGSPVMIYPRVVRQADNPMFDLVHDGSGTPIAVTIRTDDDSYEVNNSLATASPLGSQVSYTLTNLISRDDDYFEVTAPAGSGSVMISVRHWSGASDMTLIAKRPSGSLMGAAGGSGTDEEALFLTPGAGYTFYIQVAPGFDTPSFYDLVITFGPPDAVTITTPPSGTPNPVPSGGTANFSVVANDTLGHSLTYTWVLTCDSALPSKGKLVGNFTPTPTWTAPVNLTGIPRTCTVKVTASDPGGNIASASFAQTVNSIADSVTITSGPTGTPSVADAGQSVALSVTATDQLGHELNYAWQASCPFGANGSFSPGANIENPYWVVPSNTTGTQQSCTISVTVDDGLGHSATNSYQQGVRPVADAVTITAGPSGNPNPVAGGGLVTLSATATDSQSHALTYLWTSSCTGGLSAGTFSPNATAATPTWTAPSNVTGSSQTCTITITASDSFGKSASKSYAQTVTSPAHTLTITSGPSGSGSAVPSGGSVALSVTASDSLGHTLTYSWQALCPAPLTSGAFTPNAAVQAPTWTAPTNSTGAVQTCTISVTVSDGAGQTANGSFQQQVSPVATTDKVQVTALSGAPEPVASGGAVALSVTATDSLGHAISYAWEATCALLGGHGTFSPSASVATPTWNAPANTTGMQQTCTIKVTASDGSFGNTAIASILHRVDAAQHELTITAGPTAVPNTVAAAATTQLSVTATDSFGHAITYAWQATCPGLPESGVFSNGAIANPTWMAPSNNSGSSKTCSLQVIVNDGQGQSKSGTVNVTVESIANTCAYSIAPTQQAFARGGGPQTVGVTTTTGCPWQAQSDVAWITVNTPSGNGSGSISYTVAANTEPGPRSGHVTVDSQTLTVTQDGAGYTYYFAEGSTSNGFFKTRFALLNPDTSKSATVTMEFQVTVSGTRSVLTYPLTIEKQQRVTVDPSVLATTVQGMAPLAASDFSTVIRSDLPLAADRTMTWDKSGYGSHADTSVVAPASTWYLAEGSTTVFDLYYLIQNPNNVALNNEVEVTYLLPPPAKPIVRYYSLPANSRDNIVVKAEPGLGNTDVSAIIRTPVDKPIIVERAMYMSAGGWFWAAGHESAGITAPQQQWSFAEGATGDFFDLFILVANPNTQSAVATATFRFTDGTTCTTPIGNDVEAGNLVVKGNSRHNIWVDTLGTLPGCPRSLADAAVSTTITSDVPVIAERSMWWPGTGWTEAHNSPGSTSTGELWALAEGEEGGAFNSETYALIANASNYDGLAKVTLYFEVGPPEVKIMALRANSRTNLPVGAPRDAASPEGDGSGFGIKNKRFGMTVESLPVAGQAVPAQLVVERSIYSSAPGTGFWSAGSNALGTRLR